MARDDGQGECGGKEYLYGRCATCHIKVNINAYFCPRCKNRVDWNANRKEWGYWGVYASGNPEDRLYGMRLCSVERCMVCEEALRGNPCRYAVCYGTGRGRCGLCGKYEAARYACCQARREEAGAIQNDPAGRGGDGR
jgi:hypothetical protein